MGTFGNGVYQTHLTPLVTNVNTISSPSFEFHIYPNPTTNKATLEFTLNKSSVISTVIYDESGRIVRKIKKSEFKTGSNNKRSVKHCD